MAIITKQQALDMTDRMTELLIRADTTAIPRICQGDTKRAKDGDYSDAMMLLAISERMAELLAPVDEMLRRVSPRAASSSLLTLGLVLGMRYAYDHGTPQCIVDMYDELPMFKETDRG